jgi:hypothetical protein
MRLLGYAKVMCAPLGGNAANEEYMRATDLKYTLSQEAQDTYYRNGVLLEAVMSGEYIPKGTVSFLHELMKAQDWSIDARLPWGKAEAYV